MKDRYTNTLQIKDKLVSDWMAHGSLIVAYDFDNTVFDYHNTGDTYPEVEKQLIRLGHMGCYMICFTSCNPDRYPQIKQYLRERGIPCHGINIDSEKVPFKGRKIYFNVLYDDRAGLGQVVEVMDEVIQEVEHVVYQTHKDKPNIHTHCVYSGKKFNLGEWEFNNQFPAAYPEFRSERDLVPNIEDIFKLFPKR